MKDRGLESNKQPIRFDALYSVDDVVDHIVEQLPQLKDVLTLSVVNRDLNGAIDRRFKRSSPHTDALIKPHMLFYHNVGRHAFAKSEHIYRGKRAKRTAERTWRPVVDISSQVTGAELSMATLCMITFMFKDLFFGPHYFPSPGSLILLALQYAKITNELLKLYMVVPSININDQLIVFVIIGSLLIFDPLVVAAGYSVKLLHELIEYAKGTDELNTSKGITLPLYKITGAHSFFTKHEMQNYKTELENYFPTELTKESVRNKK